MKKFFTLEIKQKVLKLAAYYAVICGFIITLMPKLILQFFNIETFYLIEFWQFFGLIIGCGGIGLYIASFDPGKSWPIIFIGLLGSLMGTFVFAKSLITGSLPGSFGLVLFFSCLVWTVPFYYMLQAIYDESIVEDAPPKQYHDLIKFVRTSQSKSLLDLSSEQNVLLVFVRHFGCMFCRETVSELAKIEKVISEKKLSLVFVHMSDPSYADDFFSKYYDHPIQHISDPARALYRSFNLKRGTFYQMMGPMVWARAVYSGVFKGHGVGGLEGDSLQLGGAFVLSKGQVIFEQKASSASDVFHLDTLPEL